MIYIVEKKNKNDILKYDTLLIINPDFESNPFLKCILYVENNNILGYIFYEEIYDRIEIDYIEVDESNRRCGIATRMIDYLISYSRKHSISNITLEVRENNLPAINLYKRFDFLKVAKREKYYNGVDGILMKREI